MPDEMSWKDDSCIRTPLIDRKLVSSMLQMKPTVPKTRIGGKSFTGSIPSLARAL